MFKTEVIKKAAEKTGVPEAQAAKVVNAFIEEIENAVAAGERVVIVGFGAFEKRHMAARNGVSPVTREKIFLPEHYVPGFVAGEVFKKKTSTPPKRRRGRPRKNPM